MKVKIICLLAFMLQTVVGMAQPRSESDAISVAQKFWGYYSNKLKVVPRANITKAKTKARIASKYASSGLQPGYFVINDEANKRFVIVSGDERLYKILGYSDNGVFNASTVPYGLLEMLEEYDNQYQSVAPHLDEIGYAGTRNATVVVEPLIKTKWGQEEPFNNECPIDPNSSSGRKCSAGCSATGMAQVMNYYKYPEYGTGSNSYTSNSLKIYQEMDFSTVHPDWDNMLNYYYASSTDIQKEAVAKLLHACGVSLSSDYNRSTGVSSIHLAYSLSHFWKYNPNLSYKVKYYYNDEEWNQIIYKDLIDGYPIFYMGNGDAGGHLFILDGCDDTGLYHFNFGWEGIGNGYYSLDVIAPSSLVGYNDDFSPDILGNFSSNQIMICHVTPEIYGQPTGEFYATNSLGLRAAKTGEDISVSSELINCNTDSYESIKDSPLFEGKFGVGLFNHDFEFITSLISWDSPIYGGQSMSVEGTFKLDVSMFNDELQYYIAYYGYSDKLGYSIARTENGQEDYYLATLEGDSIIFEPMKKMRATPSHVDVWIENNVAGDLENRVSETDKNIARTWYISGEINGTDICYLKEVLAHGAITDLDLSHASIVKGGLSYFTKGNTEYYTEDNVIGDYMFEKATSLKKLSLPSSVRTIGEYAFREAALEDVVMPEKLEIIKRFAFYNCKNLQAADIPQNVIGIEDEAFSGCGELTQFIIPDKVENVGRILNSCPKLRIVHIGSAVKSFDGFFGNDSSLQFFSVSENNHYYRAIGGVLYTKDLTSIVRCPPALSSDDFVLGNDITSIQDNAFRECAKIRKIRLPEGIRVIGSGAFWKSGLESINLPASLLMIKKFSFYGCKKLCKIESEIEEYINLISSHTMINHVSSDCFWHVPAGWIETYISQPWWVPT